MYHDGVLMGNSNLVRGVNEPASEAASRTALGSIKETVCSTYLSWVRRPAVMQADVHLRVLWKGMVVLHDGMQLPGVTIVTSMQPWAHLRGTSHHEDASNLPMLEAEAELCFALEMVRHHPLRARKAERTGDAELVASGSIRLDLHAAEDVTMAYLQQLFCLPGDSILFLTFAPSTASSSSIELVVFGRVCSDGSLDLVVGREVRQPSRHTRPDDPLPRIPTRERALDARIRKRGQLSLSEHTNPPVTPGRHGEKRTHKVHVDRVPIKWEHNSPSPTPPRSASPLWHPVLPIMQNHARGTVPDASIEQANRLLIKKLIKHQLAGRGVERDHQDHAACFQTAYAGTCLVFRDALDTCALDQVRVAHIVQAHLDMYVHPHHLALCTRRA